MRATAVGNFAIECVVVHHAIHQPAALRFGSIENAAFDEHLEHRRPVGELPDRHHLLVGHRQAEPIERRAQARRAGRDAQVCHRRDLQTAADARSVDASNDRMRTSEHRRAPLVHHRRQRPRLLRVRTLGRKLADVVAGAETALAGAS